MMSTEEIYNSINCNSFTGHYGIKWDMPFNMGNDKGIYLLLGITHKTWLPYAIHNSYPSGFFLSQSPYSGINMILKKIKLSMAMLN